MTQSKFERLVRRVGLWPWVGLVVYGFYKWAQHDISPKHPDAAKVGQRYYALRAEFSQRKATRETV
jgi:hypothetical protein